jgi:cytochrome c oxidase assembly protein subunit 16
MIVSSFALQNLTKTRYDYQSSKTSTMSMEEGLGMNKDRKRVDIREEYFVSRVESSRPPSRKKAEGDEMSEKAI